MHREPFDVYVGRPSPFGNPFVPHSPGERLTVIEQYRQWFIRKLKADATFAAQVDELRGKRLGCHCAPQPCHAAVIAAYLNGEPIGCD